MPYTPESQQIDNSLLATQQLQSSWSMLKQYW